MDTLVTIYILLAVALEVVVGVVLINGCSRRVGNNFAIASFIVAILGMALLIL